MDQALTGTNWHFKPDKSGEDEVSDAEGRHRGCPSGQGLAAREPRDPWQETRRLSPVLALTDASMDSTGRQSTLRLVRLSRPDLEAWEAGEGVTLRL